MRCQRDPFSPAVSAVVVTVSDDVAAVVSVLSAEDAVDVTSVSVFLSVAEDETANQVTVRARSSVNNEVVSNELTVYIIDEPISIESVVVTPNSANVKKLASLPAS